MPLEIEGDWEDACHEGQSVDWQKGYDRRLIDNFVIADGYERVDNRLILFVSGSDAELDCWLESTPHAIVTRNSYRESIFADRLAYSIVEMRSWVDVDPARMSGVPVLKGTRFTLAQLLAELADGRSTADIAESFTLKIECIEQCLISLSIFFNRPV